MNEFKKGDRITVSGRGTTEHVVLDPEQCCERDDVGEGMSVAEVGNEDIDMCIPRNWARLVPDTTAHDPATCAGCGPCDDHADAQRDADRAETLREAHDAR